MKGMQKIKRGTGFRGAAEYVLNREPGQEPGQIIGGNMSGSTARELAHEFGASRRLRPDIEKPVWHNSLRLPEGERLDPVKLAAISDDYMQRMGFTDLHQRIYVLHDDKDGQHVHIVASRVALDGSVYLGRNENLESTKQIQALERVHGLTITRGPTLEQGQVVMPKRSQMKKGEIERAIHTGERPARLELQDLIDDALQEPCTAPEFVERLELGDIRVRPNIAQTGTMNGFSFEFKGVAFKGSSLGNDYKWKKLQERGVGYEQARDSEKLAEYKEQFSRVVEPVAGDKQGAVGIASSNIERSGTLDRIGETSRGNHQGPKGSDHLDRRADHGADEQAIEQLSGADKVISSSVDSSAESVAGDRQGDREAQGSDERGRGADQQHTAEDVDKGLNADLSGNSRRSDRGDWTKRFRMASAAKRNSTQQRNPDEAVSQNDTQRAKIIGNDFKQISPVNYLVSQGFTVKSEGRHHSVRDSQGNEQYRLTEKANGHFVWCDFYGNQGGDSLALVKDVEPDLPFIERAYRLTDSPVVAQGLTPVKRPKTKPNLPRQTESGKAQGRAYLRKRGISLGTIREAEEEGFLKYCSDGVLFCGYNQSNNEIASVTKRATDPAAEVQKKDLSGTDKSHPPILKGHNSDTLWFVEGGADALALWDIAKRQGKDEPTVIVTGGARVYSCLENKYVQRLTGDSELVIMAYENENSPSKQIKTDAGHDRQREIIKETTGRDVRAWRSSGAKDIAELNALQIKEERTREHGQDHGMSR